MGLCIRRSCSTTIHDFYHHNITDENIILFCNQFPLPWAQSMSWSIYGYDNTFKTNKVDISNTPNIMFLFGVQFIVICINLFEVITSQNASSFALYINNKIVESRQ